MMYDSGGDMSILTQAEFHKQSAVVFGSSVGASYAGQGIGSLKGGMVFNAAASYGVGVVTAAANQMVLTGRGLRGEDWERFLKDQAISSTVSFGGSLVGEEVGTGLIEREGGRSKGGNSIGNENASVDSDLESRSNSDYSISAQRDPLVSNEGRCTNITMKRLRFQLRNSEGEMEYGHWWTEMSEGGNEESVGWYPNNMSKNAAEITGEKANHLVGVPGLLNGVAEQQGREVQVVGEGSLTPLRDPHHGETPAGEAGETFHPRISEEGRANGMTCEKAAARIRRFAASYKGEWRLLNRNCRTFQRELMLDSYLEK